MEAGMSHLCMYHNLSIRNPGRKGGSMLHNTGHYSLIYHTHACTCMHMLTGGIVITHGGFSKPPIKICEKKPFPSCSQNSLAKYYCKQLNSIKR